MKSFLALLAWSIVCVGRGALLTTGGTAPSAGNQQTAFLARRDGERSSGMRVKRVTGQQPWLYNPPPATLPRAKPLEIPPDPLVLPPVDNLWDPQPSASPLTIKPPNTEEGETVGLVPTVPPRGLEGWYATIPPQAIENGLVDNRTAFYRRCLGGPYPCPYTVPPAVLRYWVPVPQIGFNNAEATTTLTEDTAMYATVLQTSTMIGFAMGRRIIIDAGSAIEEANVIAGFGSMILQYPMAYAHKAGVLITMPSVNPTTIGPAPTTPNPWIAIDRQLYLPMYAPGGAPGPAPAAVR